eukprot:GEMP01078855.1.p1 GENE.GEMP01078855.1~~GEMP01078855.1.p1  ORF type:complete len:209 (+),score=47.37 GEMP01078855.1:137-763(+)
MVAVVIAIVAVFFVVGVLIYTLGYCFFALGDNADEKEEEVVVDGEGTVMDTEVENDFWRWLKLEAVERELRRSRTVDKLERTNSQQGGRKPVSFLMQNRSLGKISPSATALDCKNTRSFDSGLSDLGPLQPCWVAERRAEEHKKCVEKIAVQPSPATPPKVCRRADFLPSRPKKPREDMYYYRPGIQLVVEAIIESKKSSAACGDENF